MKRNAFNALFKATHNSNKGSPTSLNKKANKEHAQAPAAKRPKEGSRFTECPICGRSVHASLANAHVGQCADDGTNAMLSPPLLVEGAHKMADEHDGEPRDAPSSSSPTPAACPIAPPSTVAPLDKAHVQRRSVAPPISVGILSPENNAFSRLMTASALSNFREEMYLWQHEDGKLSWGWGPVNAARPASAVPRAYDNGCFTSKKKEGKLALSRRQSSWACEIATKGPDGHKAGICELWTNLTSSTGRMQDGEVAATPTGLRAGSDENAGVKAAFPGLSLSRLSVPVLKSMMQKNVRLGRAESAVRCALELAIKSWSDAIRRILVIVIEDSLLHPAAPFVAWLMVATSKGYRPPPCLLDALLCVVYETALCPVRDSTTSCRLKDADTGEAASFADDRFSPPHPRDLVAPERRISVAGGYVQEDNNVYAGISADSGKKNGKAMDRGTAATSTGSVISTDGDHAIACCRRALLMRMSYGGMPCDQALLKGSCLSWGERCGHFSAKDETSPANHDERACTKNRACPKLTSLHPPDPPNSRGGPGDDSFPPFGYMHDSVASALQQNEWMKFLASSHTGCGMPSALRCQLLGHVIESSSGLTSQNMDKARKGDLCELCVEAAELDISKTGICVERKTGTTAVLDASSLHCRCTTARARGGFGPIVREVDAILSGVDFHCSNILDDMLRSKAVAERVTRAMRGGRGDPISNGSTLVDTNSTHGREIVGGVGSGEARMTGKDMTIPTIEGIKDAAKGAMWACSSSLNFRRLQLSFVDTGVTENITYDGEVMRQTNGILKDVGGVEGGNGAVLPGNGGTVVSGVNSRVWAVLSVDVTEWARRFVRGKLARSALLCRNKEPSS